MTRKEKFLFIVNSKQAVLEKLGVASTGLFGSVARGEDTNTSDFDILITFKHGMKNFSHFMDVIDLFESELGNVDVLTPESIPKHFEKEILKDFQNVRISA